MSNAADLAGFVPSIIPKDSLNISGGVNVAGIVTATSFDGNSDNLSINQQEVWLFGAS